MAVSLGFLVNMLKLELKEVQYDLMTLEQLYIDRHDSSEITNYVFLENTAILKAEIDSIRRIGLLLEDFAVEENDSQEIVLEKLEEYIKGIVSERQFSEAVHNYTRAKIIKIKKYLDM